MRVQMRVLYDYQAFGMQRVGGISRYFSILAKQMPALGIDVSLPMFGSDNLYMQGYGLPGKLWHFLFRKNRRLSKMLLPVLSYDLLHPTYYHPYVLSSKPARKPMVVTVHDMIHELFSSQFPDAEVVKRHKHAVCAAADRIIAISENTKRDIMDIWGIDESRIDVVYHGQMWDDDLQPQPVGLPFTGGYLLYVGDRWATYKNFKNFAIAVAPLLGKYGLHLVCTGRDFSADEMAFLHDLGIDRLTINLTVAEGALLWLYSHAACFIYPSYYEGFGIPILEAFRAGCPVLLSRASCFPEIAADAAVYFEPASPDSLQASLCSLLDDSVQRQQLCIKGAERLKLFSTRNMLYGTRQVYMDTVG